MTFSTAVARLPVGPLYDAAIAAKPAAGDGATAHAGYRRYLAGFALTAIALLAAIGGANTALTPWQHRDSTKQEIAGSLLAGKNYGVFDLNLDIRGIRRAQIAAMQHTPDIVVVGASHWQEAHGNLMPGRDVFNAHVHRDYYDDILAMVELLVKHNRLPRTMVIGIRDATFTRPEDRRDHMWTPFIPEYRAMEVRLGLPQRAWYHDFPTQPVIDRFSLTALASQATRWLKAEEWPAATTAARSATLDTLLADGSIEWADTHTRVFTAERARNLALKHARRMMRNPPVIDPEAVDAVSRTLALLRDRGVHVILAHPPFNPLFFDAVRGSRYAHLLRDVAETTQALAKANGASVVGSFDPRQLDCEERDFIDSEHSRPRCIGRLMRRIAANAP